MKKSKSGLIWLKISENRKITLTKQNPGKFGHKYINNIEITQKNQNPG
jgi:hypothetical protein